MKQLKFISYFPIYCFSQILKAAFFVIASLKHYSFKAQVEYLFKKKLVTFF